MAREKTIDDLAREVADLKRDFDLRMTDLQTRIMAVENEAVADKRARQEDTTRMNTTMAEVKSKVANLESLEDANYLSLVHMLGVIGRKLNIPARDLKTGDRRGTRRG